MVTIAFVKKLPALVFGLWSLVLVCSLIIKMWLRLKHLCVHICLLIYTRKTDGLFLSTSIVLFHSRAGRKTLWRSSPQQEVSNLCIRRVVTDSSHASPSDYTRLFLSPKHGQLVNSATFRVTLQCVLTPNVFKDQSVYFL